MQTTMYDTWLWAIDFDGRPLLPGVTVESETNVEAMVERLFEHYPSTIAIGLWQQHEGERGAINTCLAEWTRPAQYRRYPSVVLPGNPLGIFCADCGLFCEQEAPGKRWKCPHGHM